LGGRVGKSKTGWDIGYREVNLMKDVGGCYRYLDHHEMSSFLSIIEVHQDEVYEVPVGAEVIASSEKTRVEMFAIADHILGIQGHPEYTTDILFNLIDRLRDMDVIEVTFKYHIHFTVLLLFLVFECMSGGLLWL